MEDEDQRPTAPSDNGSRPRSERGGLGSSPRGAAISRRGVFGLMAGAAATVALPVGAVRAAPSRVAQLLAEEMTDYGATYVVTGVFRSEPLPLELELHGEPGSGVRIDLNSAFGPGVSLSVGDVITIRPALSREPF